MNFLKKIIKNRKKNNYFLNYINIYVSFDLVHNNRVHLDANRVGLANSNRLCCNTIFLK